MALALFGCIALYNRDQITLYGDSKIQEDIEDLVLKNYSENFVIASPSIISARIKNGHQQRENTPHFTVNLYKGE